MNNLFHVEPLETRRRHAVPYPCGTMRAHVRRHFQSKLHGHLSLGMLPLIPLRRQVSLLCLD